MKIAPVILSFALLFISSAESKTEEIPIGTILSLWDDYKEVFSAMQFALEQQHNQTNKLFHFKLYADNIKTVDAYKLTRIICRQVFFRSPKRVAASDFQAQTIIRNETAIFQIDRGIFALLGTVDPESFDTLHSYANAFEMPFVTPWFPESLYHGPSDNVQSYAVQIRPEYHMGLVDLISYYHWDKVIYIYR